GGMGNGGWGQGSWGQGGWGQGGFERRDTDEEKPVAMRYGKLPRDLPGWFEDYDTDKDGQVSLYEWRKAGRDVKDFTEMDLNGDGLITADELLRFTRAKNIEKKITDYENGDRGPGGWGLGEKINTDGGNNGKRPGGPGAGGPGGSPWGGGGGNPWGGG